MPRPLLPYLPAAALAAAALSIPLLTLLPLDHPTPTPASPAATSHPSSLLPTLPTPADFAPLLARNYRQPLTPPPPPVATQSTDLPDSPILKSNHLPVRLTGTILEPGHNLAVFSLDLNKTELHSEGDTVAGATLVHIATDHVTLNINGKNKILKIDRAPTPQSPPTLTDSTPTNP